MAAANVEAIKAEFNVSISYLSITFRSSEVVSRVNQSFSQRVV